MHGLRAMIAAFLSFHAPLVAGQPVTPLEMPFKVLGAVSYTHLTLPTIYSV